MINIKREQREVIAYYWSLRISDAELNVDWCDASTRCWSCADEVRCERCHIIPRSLGGSDEPDNLVLLCHQCHQENPNTEDPQLFWEWLKSRSSIGNESWKSKGYSAKFYGSYWFIRGLLSYQEIYKSDPVADFEDIIRDEPYFDLRSAFEDFIEKKFCRDGQRHSPATTANLLRKFFLSLKFL